MNQNHPPSNSNIIMSMHRYQENLRHFYFILFQQILIRQEWQVKTFELSKSFLCKEVRNCTFPDYLGINFTIYFVLFTLFCKISTKTALELLFAVVTEIATKYKIRHLLDILLLLTMLLLEFILAENREGRAVSLWCQCCHWCASC